MRDGDEESIERLGKFMEQKNTNIIAIPLEEYKELLIIKGKYEELSKKIPHTTI